MKQKTVRRALISLLRKAFPDVPKVLGADTREPIKRPFMKLVLTPAGCKPMCGGTRERSVDIDIWYYAANRDECEEAAEVLNDALYGGFSVNGAMLYPNGKINTEQVDANVLVCQLRVTWYETKVETGEPMKKLVVNREVLADGSNDA